MFVCNPIYDTIVTVAARKSSEQIDGRIQWRGNFPTLCLIMMLKHAETLPLYAQALSINFLSSFGMSATFDFPSLCSYLMSVF